MNFKISKDHLLESAYFEESAHFNDRPLLEKISLIVIHCISLPPGSFEIDDIVDFFKGELDHLKHPYFKEINNLKVSSHLLIDRDGNVTQFVPFDKRAWHAGSSSYNGKSDCNDFSIGIELVGTDTGIFTDEQYQALSDICKSLTDCYQIDTNDIVGHSEVSPGRKTDPGPGFDWKKFKSQLNSN